MLEDWLGNIRKNLEHIQIMLLEDIRIYSLELGAQRCVYGDSWEAGRLERRKSVLLTEEINVCER